MNLIYVDRPIDRHAAPSLAAQPAPVAAGIAAALELAPLLALIVAWPSAVAASARGGLFLMPTVLLLLVAAFGTGFGWIIAGKPAVGWTLALARSIAAVVLGALFVQSLANAFCESPRCNDATPFLPAPAAYLVFSLVVFGPIISAIVLTITLRIDRAAAHHSHSLVRTEPLNDVGAALRRRR